MECAVNKTIYIFVLRFLTLGLLLVLTACTATQILPADVDSVTTDSVISQTVNPCFESGCHQELRSAEEVFKHAPYANGLCLDCHKQYHTDPIQRLSLQSEIDLCYECHTTEALGNTHPVGDGIIDPNTSQMMTCTSTCHRSHTAPYEYLLTKSGDGALCVSCHKEFLK